jgi:hypothetical protein
MGHCCASWQLPRPPRSSLQASTAQYRTRAVRAPYNRLPSVEGEFAYEAQLLP